MQKQYTIIHSRYVKLSVSTTPGHIPNALEFLSTSTIAPLEDARTPWSKLMSAKKKNDIHQGFHIYTIIHNRK